MSSSSRQSPWWLSVLALGVWQGCGAPQEPAIGPNLVHNGSFESGLDEWWTATNAEGSKASTAAEAADSGTFGLTLYKAPGGDYSMVGQNTPGHAAGQTYQVHARLKGAVGGELVTFSYHGQSVQVGADSRWRTVNQLLLLPEINGDPSATISVSTPTHVEEATVYVDEVSFAQAVVERGDADKEKDNLVLNGSFESGLGQWSFWTNSVDGTASTDTEARSSGYAGLLLTRGADGALSIIKQALPDPVAEREEYRMEANIRSLHGGETVNLCLQINEEPWTGPCAQVTAAINWQHVSKTMRIDADMDDERVGALVSLASEGTAMVDDVVVVRTRRP